MDNSDIYDEDIDDLLGLDITQNSDKQGIPNIPANGSPQIQGTPEMEYIPPPKRAWEHLPEESPEAYEAFAIYQAVRDENAGGLAETARRCGKSESMMQKWSAKFQWKDRYAAYQNHLLLIQESEMRRAMRIEAQKWAKRRSETREVGYELGMMLAERAKRLLALPLAKQTVTKTVKASNGEIIPQEVILEFQSHPRDARLFIETGLKLMRLSADLSTENYAQLPENVDLEGMSVEDLEAYAEQLLEMRKEAE